MANQSIYSEKWIDLVFENRNKEYGAYQLRNENPKTTLKALGIGFVLITSLVSIPMFINIFGEKPIVITDNGLTSAPLEFIKVVFPPEKVTETDTAPLTQKKTEQTKPDVDQSNLIDPTVTKAENATIEIAANDDPQATFVAPIEGAISGTESGGVLGGTGTDTTVKTGLGAGNDGGIIVTAALDKQPEFPGGIQNFYNYVGRNFKTPDTEIAKTIKVYVSFVIEKDGTMSDIRVPLNPGFGLDKEAIRVLKSLKTKWSPGILNGKPVRTAYNLPIVVQQN